MSLSSLKDWSIDHIRAVFEAPTDDLSQQAVAETFSSSLTGHLNGNALDYTTLCSLVNTMRASAPKGLLVEWTRAEATPDDASNRNGALVGEYVIRGICRDGVEFERHKKVEVRITSTLEESDSRSIVQLDIVASDLRV
ncbi:hypothetical protein FB45DRAFT_886815 [Roridomyces roridus]|uniref:Uncharacterized protein n=1 Tax=Roridomyces roridus TaxID=1738132 RepID=A0AAD7CIF6_9AGAR|nr:hypothetical protein FB45DRAFT_886815 [Roridomyces roridus]